MKLDYKKSKELLELRYKKLMSYVDGTRALVSPFVETEKGNFSKAKAKGLVKKILQEVSGCSKRNIAGWDKLKPEARENAEKRYALYESYLYMMITLAYVQAKCHKERPELMDAVEMYGLEFDTSFGGLIRRAFIFDDFLQDKYKTTSVTGTLQDLNDYTSYLMTVHSVLGSVRCLIYVLGDYKFKGEYSDPSKLEWLEEDMELEELSAEEQKYLDEVMEEEADSYKQEEELFKKNFPYVEDFVQAFAIYREAYFVPGAKDNFQENMRRGVLSFLEKEGLSMQNVDVLDDALFNVFKAEKVVRNEWRKLHS